MTTLPGLCGRDGGESGSSLFMHHSGYFEGIASLDYHTAVIRGARVVMVIPNPGAKRDFAIARLTTRKQTQAAQNRFTIP